MIISNITPPQVWTSSSRSLTNIGSGALAITGASNQTLAGASNVSLKPLAGLVGTITAGILTGAGATVASSIALNDGTNNYVAVATAASAGVSAAFTMVNTVNQGAQLFNNDATHAATYGYSAFVWTI